jgi:hypothetical protein
LCILYLRLTAHIGASVTAFAGAYPTPLVSLSSKMAFSRPAEIHTHVSSRSRKCISITVHRFEAPVPPAPSPPKSTIWYRVESPPPAKWPQQGRGDPWNGGAADRQPASSNFWPLQERHDHYNDGYTEDYDHDRAGHGEWSATYRHRAIPKAPPAMRELVEVTQTLRDTHNKMRLAKQKAEFEQCKRCKRDLTRDVGQCHYCGQTRPSKWRPHQEAECPGSPTDSHASTPSREGENLLEMHDKEADGWTLEKLDNLFLAQSHPFSLYEKVSDD